MREPLFFKNVIRRTGIVWICLILVSGRGLAEPPATPQSIVLLPGQVHAIIVEKKTQMLYVYSNQGHEASLVFQTACSTGEASGVKEKAGDKKTPEGVYFLTDEFEDRYLTPIYGKRAFPTDYPNLVDRREGKNGSAIWIHGTNKKLKPMDSNGCVALENDSILKLSEFIKLNATPVIMVEEMRPADKSEQAAAREGIQRFVESWKRALTADNYHSYLSHYSAGYLPDIQWWEKWTALRDQALKKTQKISFSSENIGIYRYDQLYVLLFDFSMTIDTETVQLGKRKMFLSRSKGNWEIIGDIYQHKTAAYKHQKAPIVAAAMKLVARDQGPQLVLNTVNQWLAAWSARDIDKYSSFYSTRFHSDGLNKKRWIQRKRGLAKKYNYISVTGKDFVVKAQKDKAEVTFFQEYESSGFTTRGTKILKLVDEGGLWKIYQEIWKEK